MPSVRSEASPQAVGAVIPSPARLLVITSLCVFATEWLIMLVCEVWLDVPGAWKSWADPLALAAVVTPLLYLSLFRPMAAQVGERRRAERSLQTSEERFRSVFQNAPDAILLVDREGRVVDANPRASSFLGYGLEDLKTLSLADIEVGDPAGGLLSLWRGDGGGSAQLEGVHRHRDGSTFPVEVSAQILDRGDRPVLLALVRDVTERRRAEEALRYSEAKYSSVVENAFAGIFIAQAGRVVFTNRRLGEMLGYSREELSHLPLDSLVDPSDWAWLAERCGAGAPAEQARGDFEVRFVTRNGQTIWTLVSSVPLPYQKGLSILGYVFDVTESKKVERALAESQAELRHLSAQLMRAQEEERGRIARELHDSVGQVLTAIQFVMEREIGEVVPNERRSNMQELRPLLATVRRGMDELHRISMGLRPSVLDDLGLLPAVSWHCRELRRARPGLRIETRVDIQEEDIPEPLKLIVFRILQEAMHNAAKHSGGERVAVSIANDGGGALELRVQDDGRGFDPGCAVVDALAQGGLGLGYMRERARQSGGELRVESGSEGTLVVATWPAAALRAQGVTSPLSMA